MQYEQGLAYGLIYAIGAIGLSLPIKFLRQTDLTALGSLMLGGVAFTAMANSLGWPLALALTPLFGMLLGALTTMLWLKLDVPLMLAGIIVFTATQSFGFMLAPKGGIDLGKGVEAPLSGNFSWGDVSILAVISAGIAISIGAFSVTRFAEPFHALTGSQKLVRYRLRNSKGVCAMTLMAANGLVALAGALMAMKIKSAYPEIRGLELLTFGLGAIFSGEAAVKIIATLLRRDVPEAPTAIEAEEQLAQNQALVARFRLSLGSQREEGARLWFVLLSYCAASVLLNTVTHSVRSQTLFPFQVPSAFEHLVVAGVILAGFVLSQFRSTKSEV